MGIALALLFLLTLFKCNVHRDVLRAEYTTASQALCVSTSRKIVYDCSSTFMTLSFTWHNPDSSFKVRS